MAKLKRRLRFGFPQLERSCRPVNNHLMVLAGRPGQFKTTLAWTAAVNLALQGKSVCWVGLEMQPEQQAMRLLSRMSLVPFSAIEDSLMDGGEPLWTAQQEAVNAASKQVDAIDTILFHDQSRPSLRDVIETARQNTYDAIFLDHLGLIHGPGGEFDRMNDAITALMNLKRGITVPGYQPFICLIAQLNREIEKQDPNTEPRYPRLSDLRGTGNIEYSADSVVIMHSKWVEIEPGRMEKDIKAVVVKSREGPFPVAIPIVTHGALGYVEEGKAPEPASTEPAVFPAKQFVDDDEEVA
jgi:replicative DNA helicase